MKAIQVSEFGGPEVLQVVDLPRPEPGAGEVLVKVAAAGINFADLMSRAGTYPLNPTPPFVLGMEVAGTVEAMGAEVTQTPHLANLTAGAPVFGMVQTGGYAEYALLLAERTIPLPDGIDFAAATALLVQGLTAYFLLEAAPLRPGESVLVNAAAGGVGSLAVQIAHLKGAGTVIGTASTDEKRDFVTGALGANVAVDYTQPGWAAVVKEATGGKGVDIFFDATGEFAGEGSYALAPGGRWLVYGAQSGKMADLPGPRIGMMVGANQSLLGFNLRGVVGDTERITRALREMIGWVLSGQLKITAADRFPLTDAARAHEAVAARKTTGKVVLEP